MFNRRIYCLLKNKLLEYGKNFMVFIAAGLFFGFILPLFINVLFGPASGSMSIGAESEEFFGVLHPVMFFAFLTNTFFVLIFLIVGIISGVELPQYVRRGISRKEYFIATVTTTAIVIFLLGPFLFLLNMINNFFVSSQSILYNAFSFGHAGFSHFIFNQLFYMLLFIIGYFVAIYWQRFGRFIAILTLAIILIIIPGMISFHMPVLEHANHIGFVFSADGLFIEGFDIHFLSREVYLFITSAAIGIIGTFTYLMIKHVNIKTR